MTINTGDIKIYESSILDDSDTGGGLITHNEVVSGASNNLFDNISAIDRVYGSVKMRKFFGGINTQTVDKYYGAHIIIAKLPEDEKIGMTLFSTGSWFDRRDDARDRLENYLGVSSLLNCAIWGTAFQGSKIITIFQHPDTALFVTGQSIMLRQGSAFGANEQYIRIASVEHEVQTFQSTTGDYEKRILTIECTDALDYDFKGIEMTKVHTKVGEDPDRADVYKTIVVNAARYYGSHPLDEPIEVNDTVIKVDSIFNQLVPSSRAEIAMIDLQATTTKAVEAISTVDNTAGQVRFSNLSTQVTNKTVFQAGQSMKLPTPIQRGSLVITTGGGAHNAPAANFDDGFGKMDDLHGVGQFDIDYLEGTITNNTDGQLRLNGVHFAEFIPATYTRPTANSKSIPVTSITRGFVYVASLFPLPELGTCVVSYMALGKWYDLVDDGTGNLHGSDVSLGSAAINTESGSLSVTLGFLPDTDTDIIISWATPSTFINRSENIAKPTEIVHQLSATQIEASTVVINWNDGTAKTATCDALGDITGDATGTVDAATGLVKFSPNDIPLMNSQFTIDFSNSTKLTASHTYSASGSIVTLDLNATNINPNSVKLSFLSSVTLSELQSLNVMLWQVVTKINNLPHQFKDTGGALAYLDGTILPSSTIDYALGIITFESAFEAPIRYFDKKIVNNSLRRV